MSQRTLKQRGPQGKASRRGQKCNPHKTEDMCKHVTWSASRIKRQPDKQYSDKQKGFAFLLVTYCYH